LESSFWWNFIHSLTCDNSRGPTMSVTFPCMHTGFMIHVLANCQNFGIIFLMGLYVLLAL
jgi:hypothetical protein